MIFEPSFALAGLVVGTCVGLSGVGGSALLAPILILLLGVKPSVAIGTDLLYSVPTKLLALGLHMRQRTVDWRVTRLLLLGGVLGSLGGLAIAAQLRHLFRPELLQPILRHGIGVAILIACLGTAVMMLRRGGSAVDPNDVVRRLPAVATAGIGLVVGLLVAVTSIGSGSVTLPLLILAFPAFSLRRLIGSEIAFAAFLVPLSATGYLAFGEVNWPMVLSLLVGSLPGVWIGSRLVRLIGESWLRPVILGVLGFAGARLL